VTWSENADGAHTLRDSHGMVAGCWRGSWEGEDVWFVGRWTDDTRREWKRVGYTRTLRGAKRAAAEIAP
jgi:hypothetical protein